MTKVDEAIQDCRARALGGSDSLYDTLADALIELQDKIDEAIEKASIEGFKHGWEAGMAEAQNVRLVTRREAR